MMDLRTEQDDKRDKLTPCTAPSTFKQITIESITPPLNVFYFFFFGFFFFTPPAAADAVGIVAVVGTVGAGVERPVSTGERISATEAGIDASSRRCWFCIFCMRDKFRDSNRLRKIDEFVLNLRHFGK
jgi:hypothetical protein